MSAIPLRQRTATELVDAALQLYRLDPLQFITASALIYVPWIVVQVALGINTASTAPLSIATTIVSLAGTMIVYVFVGGVTTVLASDVYFGRPADVARGFRTVGARIGPLVLAMAMSGILIFIGFVVLLVPGIYAACRFFAVRQAVLLENTSAGDAMSRSSALSDGTKRHILNTLILVTILVGVINLGGGLLIRLIPSSVAVITLTALLSAVLYPFFGITETLLYYDTRIRREGFDVEYLASSAPSGEAPSAASL
jgi:hypothetical protein